MGASESLNAVAAGPLLRAEVESDLPPHLLNRVLVFDEVDSTNSFAQRNAANLRGGSVIIADHQTGGRGRMGRSWYSEPGASLLVSYMAMLTGHAVGDGLYPMAASLAVCRAARVALNEKPISPAVSERHCTIKWPNDVEYRGAKLAGILINSTGPTMCAIGIGINVSKMQFPKNLRGPATSLAELTDIRRMALLAILVQKLDEAVTRMANPRELVRDYRTCLGHVGERIHMQQIVDGHPVEGVFAGVQDDGAALVETDVGLQAFHAGDLSRVPSTRRH